MGRITDIIPHLYGSKNNDLLRFTGVLDENISELEKLVGGITDLTNIDKCPDDKLPYLAAMINCPLMGDNPILWRRQIKNWPYILKYKGTAASLALFLNSIDADSYEISTFFRNEAGELVTEKPEGEPFIGDDGIWRNIRTHYFDIDIFWDKIDAVVRQNWYKDFLKTFDVWIKYAKPFHAELRNMQLSFSAKEDMSLFAAAFPLLTGELYIRPEPPVVSSTGRLFSGITLLESGEISLGLDRLRQQKDTFYAGVVDGKDFGLEIGVDLDTMQDLLLRFESRIFERMDRQEKRISQLIDLVNDNLSKRLDKIEKQLQWAGDDEEL